MTTTLRNVAFNPSSTGAYFKHEIGSMNDSALSELVEDEGAKGLGAYWSILEFLGGAPNNCCSIKALCNLMRRLKVRNSYLLHILYDYNLFVIEGEVVYSPKLDTLMLAYNSKVSQSIEKAASKTKTTASKSQTTASKLQTTASKTQTTASKLQTTASKLQSTSSKTQVNSINLDLTNQADAPPVEDKELNTSQLTETDCDDEADALLIEKNRIEKNRIEKNREEQNREEKENSSSSSLKEEEEGRKEEVLSDSAEEPSKPGWELMIDQACKDQPWLDLMGMRSTLGKLFIDRFDDIIRLFKIHVKSFGKDEMIKSEGLAKYHFSLFVTPGTKMHTNLLAQLKSGTPVVPTVAEMTAAVTNPYRFEYRNPQTGERSYNGTPIPPDAPPRPSNDSMWDFNLNIWR